ncbi:2-octaprenyl-3-methyl-6-methoxy-1,4-benzoquinol hydroxylase [Chelonobacter oris]|uniref:2-octaprenyl-3-methyl-6-methoxy-1,4-benzoquinol hydroxylase n=1 Tax=Chelonobacter oris TaxID=505317 RepID=A0A0A3AQ95_9PAST|nr:FAD-dependent monooxygenase [Chelonobacter oris]KGQ69952.1 2-octaprenyl-3-methyl-6-methoxy-1,4-benzoquinol hydroxylase [Chelonobacter oris]MDH3000637.1 2-octaprenyl-3-methyl-6-methoxy-1,4-benzoquinol hydroxylase [Chelonobacter oris]
MVHQKEIIVVGGGMVGSAAALGLARLGVNVHLIERAALPHFEPGQAYDIRISAISAASVNLLNALQAWPKIAAMRTCPYRRLETWEIDGFSTQFHAQDLGLSELGYMVENNLIQLGLWQTFADYPNLTYSVNRDIRAAQKCGHDWQISVSGGERYAAPLLLACDGANSKLRQLAGIGLSGWQYRQSCLLILVDTALEQQDITWQQFFPTGPRAFLPLPGNQACLVWYDSPERIRHLQQLPLVSLNHEIQHAFPARLGEVKSKTTASFALTRRHAQTYFKNGIALLGDAAHTINPLAGQGVNLGFKDVKVLLDVIAEAQKCGQTITDEAVLRRYSRLRTPDNVLMQTGMDLFYKSFKETHLPLKILRNAALVAIDKALPIKKQALKYALGL